MEEYDIVFCIFACDTIDYYYDQIIKINETWGKVAESYNIKILFFLGGKDNENRKFSGSNYVYLENISNDYISASYKQFLGLKYIHDNYKTKFIHCCGTDTYINIKKIVRLIKNYNYNNNLYIGGEGDHRTIIPNLNKIYFHSGGPGFILTNTCLKELYPLLDNIVDEWITLCKLNNIEDLYFACDVCIAYYLANLKNSPTIVIIPGNYFTNSAYNWVNVIQKNIISCHNMSIYDFDDFTKLLEENNYFEDL